ncbi:transglycosylase SLT domain-containing protein [Bradyrhizobium sp. USDA 10063]
MKFPFALTFPAAIAAVLLGSPAQAQQRTQYEALIATHAQANLVPDALVHRVIVRESKYQPNLIGRGGAIGLMQIKLATARGLGYKGDAAGLRDPETNLAYGIKYLAGAYRAAGGNHDRAVRYYAGGYYYAAKQQRLQHLRESRPTLAAASQKEQATAEPLGSAVDANAQQIPGN